jgi:hypothetical protein
MAEVVVVVYVEATLSSKEFQHFLVADGCFGIMLEIPARHDFTQCDL